MTLSFAVLTTALLFGGMTLYAFGFAAFLFTALPAEIAGATLSRAFPLFYLFVILTAALACAFVSPHNLLAGILPALIAGTTVPLRQILMPAINAATDHGNRRRFKWLHGLSVLITLAHIAAQPLLPGVTRTLPLIIQRQIGGSGGSTQIRWFRSTPRLYPASVRSGFLRCFKVVLYA